MAHRFTYLVNDKMVYLYTYIKDTKNAKKQFTDFIPLIPTLRKELLKENCFVEFMSRKKEKSPRQFGWFNKNIKKCLVCFMKDELDVEVLIDPTVRTEYNSPWVFIDEEGERCSCSFPGTANLHCLIHHYDSKGHHFNCDCIEEMEKNPPLEIITSYKIFPKKKKTKYIYLKTFLEKPLKRSL